MNTIYLNSTDPDVVAYVEEQDRLRRDFYAKVKAFHEEHEDLEPAGYSSPFDLEMFVGGIRTDHPEQLPGQWRQPDSKNVRAPYQNNKEGRALISGMHFIAPDYPGVCTQTFAGDRCLPTFAFAHEGTAWACAGARADDGSPRYDPDKWTECLHWQYEKAAHDEDELRKAKA